jgi:hypothetical protein
MAQLKKWRFMAESHYYMLNANGQMQLTLTCGFMLLEIIVKLKPTTYYHSIASADLLRNHPTCINISLVAQYIFLTKIFKMARRNTMD